MAYLYLFYEDYIGDSSIDPYAIITSVKDNIKKNALNKIQHGVQESFEVERKFEQLYALNDSRDEFANIQVQQRYQQVNLILNDFDEAIAALKQKIQEGNSEVVPAITLGNNIIRDIDTILNFGAKTGGLADGAISQVEQFKRRMEENVQTKLHYIENSNKQLSDSKKPLIDELTAIQSNISGYMLEIAHIYAFLQGNSAFLGQMINIGSQNRDDQIFTFKQDPKIEADRIKLNEALKDNKVQSKADAIFNLHFAKQDGTISAETFWVGFQQKNFNDVSSIRVGKYTLGNIGITQYYNEDFLVNIAGTLAGTKYQARDTIPPNLRRHKEKMSTQTEVDRIWTNIKNSTKLLGVVDAVSGNQFANITNRVHYYVIRNKQTKTIKVIPVSTLLQRIQEAFEKDIDSAYGINTGQVSKDQRIGDRSEYWSINVENFSTSSNSQERSSKAYQLILDKILSTKVSIAINFNSFFNT